MKKRQYILPEIKVFEATVLLLNDISLIKINGETCDIQVEKEEGDGSDQAISHFNVWDE